MKWFFFVGLSVICKGKVIELQKRPGKGLSDGPCSLKTCSVCLYPLLELPECALTSDAAVSDSVRPPSCSWVAFIEAHL